jgi:hypothetical protein
MLCTRNVSHHHPCCPREELSLTFGMPELELNQEPAGKGSEYTKEDDEDEAWDEPDDCQTGGKREHAIADDFGNHQDSDHLP